MAKEYVTMTMVDFLKLYYMITYDMDSIKASGFREFFSKGDNLDVESFIERFQKKLLTAVNTDRKKKLTLRTGIRYTKPAMEEFVGKTMEELGYDK